MFRSNTCILLYSTLLCLIIHYSFSLSSVSPVLRRSKIVVAGATGRVGRLVVKELLSRKVNSANETISISVTAAVRDVDKAKSIFTQLGDNVDIVSCDLNQLKDISKVCEDADALIWCATGFSQASSFWDKFFSIFSLVVSPKKSMDITALQQIGNVLRDREDGVVKDGPVVVMCSSAAVTRPVWSNEKKKLLIGAADIPIVRLNPLDILGVKRESEEVLRATGVNYCIVRPCGISDTWPNGRPVISQGDVAVGRTSPSDCASLLVDALLDSASSRKTFESISIPGFPKPKSYTDQFSRLQPDGAVPLSDDILFAQYSLLQQLVPGETLAPNQLAMGQTYEQLDEGKQGRLGPRGSELAPIAVDTK